MKFVPIHFSMIPIKILDGFYIINKITPLKLVIVSPKNFQIADVSQEYMINKINKERRRSMNATPHDPATRTSGKKPRRTPNKTQDRALGRARTG